MARQVVDVAGQINHEHELCSTATAKAIEHAMRCGDLLTVAKASCLHGEWEPWLSENFDGSTRTARSYMRLSGNRELIEAKTAESSVLTIDAAIKLLSGPNAIRVPHVANSSGNNEWYTPQEYIEAARRVLGGIDLDPASSDIAQQTVKADVYYTIDDDGLGQEWSGRVWLNPPYTAGLVDRFVDKLLTEIVGGGVSEAILLVNNASETKWFQRSAICASAFCLPAGRIRFLDADGNPVGCPLQGQTLFYFGDSPGRFREVFSTFGATGKFDQAPQIMEEAA